MSKFLLVLILFVVFPSASLARLGETKQQDIARYGNPVKDQDRFSPILKNAITSTYSFQGWKIRAGYLEGLAVRISYSKLPQPGYSPRLEEDEITAILNAETHGGNWEKLRPASLLNNKKSGNNLFDGSQLRWINTNGNIAYTLLGNTTLYIESPTALIWEKRIDLKKEDRRKESIPQF